jgi:DNA polymerase III gamma/tau subunit
MIVTLCAQVQALTTQQAQPITTPPQHPRDISKQQEKRQDIKMTPRKSKRSNDFTADSEAAEGSQQSATQPEDRPTVWDDYLTTQQND